MKNQKHAVQLQLVGATNRMVKKQGQINFLVTMQIILNVHRETTKIFALTLSWAIV